MGTTPTYSWPYPEATGLVKDGWEDIKDLATAIDTTAAASFGGGLVFINTTSFTTQSSVSVNNVFTSTYTNYKILINPTAFSATNSAINIRLRASGTDASGTDYNSERQRNENGSLTATRFASQTAFQVGAFNTSGATRNFKELNIYSPQAAVTTSFWTVGNYVDNAGSLKTEMNGGYHALSSSYDGFTLTLDSGTISGSLSIYGYKK